MNSEDEDRLKAGGLVCSSGLIGMVMTLVFTISEMGKEKPLQGFEPKSDMI